MFCANPDCGTELPNTVRFCPNCGNRRFSATAPPPPQPAQPVYTTAPPLPASPPGTKYCTQCGLEVLATLRFCPADGNRTFSDTPPVLQPHGTAPPPSSSPPLRRPSPWYRWRSAQAALAVVLLAAIGGGIYGWQYYDELWRQEEELRQHDQAQTEWAQGNNALMSRSADQAIAHYTRAIALWPAFAPAYVSRGSAQLQLTHFEEATADYDEAVKRDPKYAEAYFARGVYYWYRGDLPSAEDDMRKLVALQPENDFYADWFAKVLYRQKSPEKDAEVERFYRRLYDENHKRAWALEGWLGSIADNDERVERECEALEAHGSATPMVEYYHGRALKALNRVSEAIPHLKLAAAADPSTMPTDVMVLLAQAEKSIGDTAACLAAIENYTKRMGRSEKTDTAQKSVCG